MIGQFVKQFLIQKKLVDLIFEFFDGRWKGKNSIALPTPQALTTPTIWNFPLSIVQQDYEIVFFRIKNCIKELTNHYKKVVAS